MPASLKSIPGRLGLGFWEQERGSEEEAGRWEIAGTRQ